VTFANPLPWWVLVLVTAAAAVVAAFAYRQFAGAARQRAVLTGIRFITLLLLLLFLMRPVMRAPNHQARDAIVPILVDVSRSMGIQDAGKSGGTAHASGGDAVRRIDRARTLVADQLMPSLETRFHVEVLGFGDSLAPQTVDKMSATARRSDLRSALAGVRGRYRGQVVAGIVLLTDGGDTSGVGERAVVDAGVPVYPIGIGSRTLNGDREILSVTAAETVMDDSRIDLAVSAVSHAPGNDSIELRLLENGRPVDVRRVTSLGSGSPVREVFQVFPRQGAATVYTVETPAAARELVPENNRRSVLVQGPSRSRRILLIEGAPGFEHSFLKRAWAGDSGLELDSVVRKGKNEQGSDTFYIQAAKARSDALANGYPAKSEELFAYDALVLANVDGAMLTRAQLDATREFVGRRGGGLLVLGARSFLREGLLDTAVEEALPLQLSERSGGVLPASATRGMNRLTLTPEGAAHPIMQIAGNADDTRKRWDGVPALASIASLGGPRPGASVLAVTSGAGGTPRALIAVQRYGEGRTMVFTGEAAWRWRMMLPAADRSYDTFWRQAVRWLALPATDPISVSVPAAAATGDALQLRIAVRDSAFLPQRDATVDLRVSRPDGHLDQIRATADAEAGAEGRFNAAYRPDQPGVYRVSAEARRGTTVLGSASSSMLVGGADVEMTDPRVNQQLLQRIALASGGRVVQEADVASLADSLTASLPRAELAVTRDLWHNGWSFAVIVVMLGTEWILRRRWGLR
jgi:uncharacterized membrane protein